MVHILIIVPRRLLRAVPQQATIAPAQPAAGVRPDDEHCRVVVARPRHDGPPDARGGPVELDGRDARGGLAAEEELRARVRAQGHLLRAAVAHQGTAERSEGECGERKRGRSVGAAAR